MPGTALFDVERDIALLCPCLQLLGGKAESPCNSSPKTFTSATLAAVPLTVWTSPRVAFDPNVHLHAEVPLHALSRLESRPHRFSRQRTRAS